MEANKKISTGQQLGCMYNIDEDTEEDDTGGAAKHTPGWA
jgi:hypothetical protein